MSLEFLSTSPSAPARSPMERQAEAAGAAFELRDGWMVATGYRHDEEAPLQKTVAFSDSSHLGKLELYERHELEPGIAERRDGAWWCPLSVQRALVICQAADLPSLRDRLGPRAIDVTSSYAALTIAGPLSRELFARFCAIDLRPQTTPVHGWRPGSVARTPGAILREDSDRFLMLFGFALGEYMWTTVADAASALGGAPVGVESLAPRSEEAVHA